VLGNLGILRVSPKSQTLPPKAWKNLLIPIKHMRQRQSAEWRMRLTTLRGLYTAVRIRPGQMTFRRSAENSDRDQRGSDTHDAHPRDPEDRVIDNCNEQQRKDKEMDKTLADSFPASDPPAWESDVGLSKPADITCEGE
jgi:hypothetical protein